MDDDPLYFRIRNWHHFQHYRGRKISWIKNYLDLDDPSSDFRKLSFSDQGKLQAIWRLAAKLDNMIPYDEAYVKKAIGAKRIPFGSQLVPKWATVGTQTELEKIANAEEAAAKQGFSASSVLAKMEQKASLEVRSKNKERTSEAKLAMSPLRNPSAADEKEQELQRLLAEVRHRDDATEQTFRQYAARLPVAAIAAAREELLNRRRGESPKIRHESRYVSTLLREWVREGRYSRPAA
ncbi:MAG: hypothetical protein ACYC9L_05700 [Sulfuricaulis sp.]